MSSNEWRILSLGEVCLKITDGAHFSPKDDLNGFPMASVKDLTRYGVNIDTCRLIGKHDFENLKAQGCMPLVGDVLIAKDGNTSLDTVCVFDQNQELVLLSSIAILRPNPALVTSDFLNYYFDNPIMKSFLKDNFRSGSAIPRVILRDFRSTAIKLPNLDTQHKIAGILRGIDNKIENNLATNQTLEDIARTLFKEWFVNFNYPTADGQLKHSEPGDIPESWGIGTLADIYKTTSGGTPSRNKAEYYENGTIGWVKSKELNNSSIIDTEEKITEDALKNSSAKLLPKYSVLIAMYGATVGEIGVTTEQFTCNQAICSFLPNENYPFSFIYNFLLHSKQDIIARAVGSAQQNISQQVLLQFKLVIPPSELVQEYHRIVLPLFQKIQDNIEENESLRDLRDSLLPKLMSGAIDVNLSNAQ